MRFDNLEDEEAVLVYQRIIVEPTFEVCMAFANQRRIDLCRVFARKPELGKLVGVGPRDIPDADDRISQICSTVRNQSVAEAQARNLRLAVPTGILEIAGEGVEGHVDGRPAAVGGVAFVASRVAAGSGVTLLRSTTPGAVRVAVAVDGELAGWLEKSYWPTNCVKAPRRCSARCANSASSASCWPPATAAPWPTPSPPGYPSTPCART